MADKIKIGIVGYGNLGKGAHLALRNSPDMELVGVFTRREPEQVALKFDDTKAYKISELPSFQGKIDVLILCGGSATDLPEQGPELSKLFHTVDSFDTHARIPEYFAKMDEGGKASGKVSIISVGWDPGIFSMTRALFGTCLPDGKDYTFWGRGVSQGHSDAIRRVKGVKNAVQYTVPIKEAVDMARSGKNPELETREKHLRECFVVAEEGADKKRIEFDIKEMPNYFADYDTKVHFITEEELLREHSSMPHGGFVIRSGKTDEQNKHLLQLSLKLDSNPEFTSGVLVAYARAAYRLAQEKKSGAFSVLDIPLSYLSPKTPEDLRRELL